MQKARAVRVDGATRGARPCASAVWVQNTVCDNVQWSTISLLLLSSGHAVTVVHSCAKDNRISVQHSFL